MFNVIGNIFRRHGNKILFGFGIGGMLSTTALTAYATVKAVKAIEKKEEETGEKLTKKDKVKVCWKYFVAPMATLGISTVCLVGSAKNSWRKNAALAAACSLSEGFVQEAAIYKDKVKDIVGEEKEKEIATETAKEIAKDEIQFVDREVIVKKDESLFFDSLTKRFLTTTKNRLDESMNELNRYLLNNDEVTLHDYCCEIGLEPIDNSENISWLMEKGSIDWSYVLDFTKDGDPYIIIYHNVKPKLRHI